MNTNSDFLSKSDFLSRFLRAGFGPFDSQSQAIAFYTCLGLVAATALVCMAIVIKYRKGVKALDGFSLGIRGVFLWELFLFLLNVPFIYILWLAFGTPYNRLPFAPPAAGSAVFFVPAPATYEVAATLTHGFLALLCIYWFDIAITIAISLQLKPPFGGFLGGLASIVMYAFAVTGIELQNWPAWFTVLGELYAASIVVNVCARAVAKTLEWWQDHSPRGFRRVERIRATFGKLLFLGIGGFILLAHNPQGDALGIFVDLFALFFLLKQPDEIVANIVAFFRPREDDYHIESPRRWLVTMPLTLGVVFLASVGLFLPISVNTGLTPQAWLEAGAAVTAFMLFIPLTELARINAGARVSQVQHDRSQTHIINDTLLAFGAALVNGTTAQESQQEAQSLRSTITSGISALAKAGNADNADSTGDAGSTGSTASNKIGELLQQTVTKLSGSNQPDDSEYEDDPKEREKQIFNSLRFRAFWFFLFALLIYHVLVVTFHLDSLLNLNLVTLVLGLVGVVAGLLQVINNPVIEATRDVFLLLIFVILIVTGIAVLFTLAPQTNMILPAVAPSGGGLAVFTADTASDAVFYALAGRTLTQELLVFLAVGELAYLFKIIDTTVVLDQRRKREKEDEAWTIHATRLYDKKKYDKALRACEKALNLNPKCAPAFYQAGRIQMAQEDYDRAIQLFEEAITLDHTNKGYQDAKAQAVVAKAGATVDQPHAINPPDQGSMQQQQAHLPTPPEALA